MNDITFIKGASGLGTPLSGKDFYSGLVFYLPGATALPAGFDTTHRTKQVFQIQDAEALGIAQGSSNYGFMWYHINEFFSLAPKGVLYIHIGVNPVGPAVHDFAEITTMQNYANGEIRQVGVYYNDVAFATSQVNSAQAIYTALNTAHKPLHIILAPDIHAVTDLTTLSDLTALTDGQVSVCIGQDAGGAGLALFTSLVKSITCVGAMLGTVALSAVNENIGWVGKFNQTHGVELDIIAISNGALIADQSDSLLTAIQNKGYTFLRKQVGIAGSYYNDSFTAIIVTDDYHTIENNRTMDKAKRGIRTYLLPKLNSPLFVQSDGTLRPDTIADFQTTTEQALEQMKIANELSAYQVIINPAQNVISTSKLAITVKIIPVGVARQIEVTVGFTLKVS